MMDTLRERNTHLLRTGPDREAVVSSIDTPYTAVKAPYSAMSPTQEVTPVNPPLSVHASTDDLSRFSAGYQDPLFPQRSISYGATKRFFDLCFALTLLTVLSPVMLVVAVIIKLTDRGPILFKQVRVGKGGRFFHCYKFRSMCVDAEAKKQELMHLNEASGPVFKIKRDPRVTRIGAFIRKLSIDELPQFFNVVKGEMSVVGPRPPIPCEVDQYSDHERKRLAVHPGITCLWQIGGRSNVTFEKWVELDLEYIETMCFSKDVMIVLKTIPAVLKGSGAH